MQEKEYALEVYNALNGSDYDDPDLLEMVSLEGGISLSMRNDASFIIGMELNLYEHQSTFNANMPFRQFVYAAELYKSYVKETKQDALSRKKLVLPNPRFAVFYNGNEKRPEKEILKLSDLYAHSEERHELELVCIVYNINPNNNKEFMSKCRTLSQYTAFIEKVRENQKKHLEKPIEEAIAYCVANDILKDFLIRRQDEVLKAMVLDMTFEAREPLIKKEAFEDGRLAGIEEGIKEGITAGRSAGIIEAYKHDMISKENAIALLDITQKDFDELVETYAVSE